MTGKTKPDEPKKEKAAEPAVAPTDDLSEEDKRLQEELNMLVEKLLGHEVDLYFPSLQMLSNLIRTSTTSMTSVPKPLKFLREHYPALKQVYEKIKDPKTKQFCADVVSVLAMGVSGSPDAAEKRECLKYCLLGTKSNVGDWGHEYVRQLEGEIAEEWNADNMDTLLSLVQDVISFDMKHSAEIQACDLLMEIDRLDLLTQHMEESNYPRVCLYLIGCASYVVEPESTQILQGVLHTYQRFGEYPRALLVAMQLNDKPKCEEVFNACTDPLIKKQLCYMLARQYVPLDIDDEDLRTILLNAHINDHFLSLGRELDIMEPKTPEEVYKTWLESAGSALRPSLLTEHPVDSARQNLSATFVNAFVNAGFGRDKLVTTEDGNKWMYKNKDHAAASLGMIHLWDVDGGLTPIDKYLYTADEHIKAGALLALGLVNCGVRNECDPALALLSDYVMHTSSNLRIGSVLGERTNLTYNECDPGLALLSDYVMHTSSNLRIGSVLGERTKLTYNECDPALALLSDYVMHTSSNLRIGSVLGERTKLTYNECDPALALLSDYVMHTSSNLRIGSVLGERTKLTYNECDPALALLSGYVMHTSSNLRIGSVLGLGIAYAGTQREDVLSHLLPVLSDTAAPPEICALAAISCGLIAVGSCNGDVSCKEKTEATMAALEVLPEPQQSLCQTTLSMCAYAGTGDVLVNEQSSTEDTAFKKADKKEAKESTGSSSSVGAAAASSSSTSKDDKNKMQAVATLGVAVIALGEETGAEMCTRIFGQLLSVIDVLNKYSHDSDNDVAYNAIFAMGLTGDNAPRVGAVPRQVARAPVHGAPGAGAVPRRQGHHHAVPGAQRPPPGVAARARRPARLSILALYHGKSPVHLFMVRLAQGLCHAGKGTITLCPAHSDRHLASQPALARLLVVMTAFLDCKNSEYTGAVPQQVARAPVHGAPGAGAVPRRQGHHHAVPCAQRPPPRVAARARRPARLSILALYHGKSPVHLFMVRLAQGLCHAGKGTITLCPAHSDRRLVSQPALAGLLVAVDVIGKAGTPKTIAGSHTHTTPVLLSFGERAELATDEYIPLSPVMEGFVILKKNEDSIMASSIL
ncbi:26S proteasome non-ATPase regulatory subunit 2 [Operophtera brumata]|uniref:26S proteasome non-ATPase regulatory subunit 2 n=4 Tax=Obtectomera TaxID=104431 RepID=A0A0L7LMA2_OPEBR|nr:26S proteasome non-ATPase regulatory subunit 2 [Operophtera brumata]